MRLSVAPQFQVRGVIFHMNIRSLASLSVLGAAFFLLSNLAERPAFGQAPGANTPPAAPGAGVAPPEAVRKAAQQWQTAVNFQKAKKYKEAIAAYGVFLQSTKQAGLPANTAQAAYQNLAAIYRAHGKSQELAGALNSWAALAPDNPALHAELASIYASSGMRKFDDAEKEARQALALKPARPLAASAHSTLGIVAVGRKDYAAAEEEFGQSAKLVPGNSQMEYNLGLALVERKKFAPALAAMQRAAAANPKMAGAWYYIGLLNESQQKYPEALKGFRQAIRLAPADPTIRFDLARAQVRSRDMEGAIGTYLAAIKLAPRNANARMAIAQLYLQSSNYAAARAHLAEAVKWEPKNAQALVSLARCETQLSNQPQDPAGRSKLMQQAEAHYQAAAAIDPAFLVGPNGLAQFYERAGEFVKAQEVYRKRIGAEPDNFALYNLLAGTHVMQRKPEDAIAVLRRYKDRNPGDPASYMRIAELLETQAKWLDAVAEWKLLLAAPRAPKLGPLQPGTVASAMVAIGRDLARAGKTKEAGEQLEAILTLDSTGSGSPNETRAAAIATIKAERLEAMQQLTQIAERENKLDEAIRWQQQIKVEEAAAAEQANGTPNGATYIALSRLYVRANKPELAIKELDALTQTRQKSKESFAPAYEELAQVYESLMRYDDAIAAYRRSALYSKEPLNGRLRAAEVYQRNGRLPLAVAEFEAIQKDFPNEGRVLTPLAMAYRQAGRDADAIRTYDSLLLADPKAIWARDQKAVVLTHMKRYDDARAIYEAQLVRNAQSRQLYADIAFVFQSEGKPDAFLDWIKPRFEKDPANATLMAVLLDEATRQKKEELGWSLLRASAQKNKGQRALVEATAGLMAQRGRREDALALYRQLATQNPKDVTAQLAFADQLFAAGRKEEAMKLYAGLIARTDIAPAEKLNVRRQFARCCSELGNSAEALAQLQEIVKADPNDTDSTARLALQLEAAGRGAEAIPLLQVLATREVYSLPVRAQIHGKVAGLLLKKGDKAAAEAEYRKALQLNPKDTVAQAGLAGLGGK